MLKVETDGDSLNFRPGNVLSGRIVWELSKTPRSISASLSWSTEGKGDEDGESSIQQTWTPSSPTGTQAFQWQLPRGPISLEGTLIRIQWLIECVSESPDEEVVVPLVISHLKCPVRLSKVP
ncbi:MAG: hypothetical protein SGI77_24290 [Pirellulaceae bacterium]|nr:hypothetical protein [Pirellulaceae bacterium]